ncbi:MAG: EamA family transporter [Chitinophagaceae bacterium]
MISNQGKGYILAVSAAICWGISGTFGQYLFQTKHLDADWLVTVRLLISGLLLLALAQTKKQINLLGVWKTRQDRLSLILFSIGGMLAVQYTYFATIKFSNAATATILQYLGPAMITTYIALKNWKLPVATEIMAIILAITGTFLLVTHGNPKTLSISGQALFWGISSAFALAFYSIQPIPLLHKWDPVVVIGWAMLIAGIACGFIHPPWRFEGDWDEITFLLVAFIILFATLGAFYAYLVSIKYIGATKASLLACTEPLSAALLGVSWLKTPFGLFDWIGTAMILITVILLSIRKRSVYVPNTSVISTLK